MKKIYLFSLLCISLLLFSCSPAPQKKPEKEAVISQKEKSPYPEELNRVFEKHGGLRQWQSMQALSYEIVKEGGNEKQFVNLGDRRERIEAFDFQMGYDGQVYWLAAGDDYKGNPKFYKGLMFYFYAMPFVLADEGIIYGETEDLLFEGISYPGIRISYEAEIGVSPEDEYFLYYDPESHQMAWLGYTVTFNSQQKSDDIHWIRYNNWDWVDGILLPKSMTWYTTGEGGKPSEVRRTREFIEVRLNQNAFEDVFFEKPKDAEIIE